MKNSMWILLAGLLLFASSAEANVRAPIVTDGGVVIAKLASEATQAITLTHQKLVVTLPVQVDKEFGSLDAQVEATYTFQNDGDDVEVPMVFLATGIADARVVVNAGEPMLPQAGEMNDAQRDELAQAAQKYAPTRQSYTPPNKAGATATFQLRLQPGKNTVTFTYAQDTRYDENGTRYGGPRNDRSQIELIYLLYPCRAWKKSDGFALEVAVNVPDYKDNGWFWDTYWEPVTSINIPLTAAYDKKTRQTTYTGKFTEYPDDVLHVDVKRGPTR